MGTPMGYPATFLLSLDYVLRPLQELSQSNQGRAADMGRPQTHWSRW